MSAAYFYDAEGRDREISFDEAVSLGRIKEDQLVWFDIERSDDKLLDRIANALKLEAETVRKLKTGRPVASIVSFECYFYFGLTCARGKKPRIDFVVGDEWLLTLRDQEIEYFGSYRERDRQESLIGRLSPVALAGSLIDWHFEEFQAAADELQAKLDKLDGSILGRRHARPPLSQLARMRTHVSHLRVRLDSHRALIHALLRPDFAPVADEKQAQFFTVLESHFNRTLDALDSAREGVGSSFDLYATKTGQETNDLVRLLTLVTVATGMGAAVAGILGMNFDVPIFHTGWIGFIAAISIIFGAAVLVFLIAWRRRWL